jgi:ribose transport system permease protein
MKEFGILAALLLLCIIISIFSPYFLKTSNLFNVLQQFSIYAILAIGETLIIIAGGIDLSIGTVMGLMGILAASLAVAGVPLPLVFIVVLIAGGLVGSINAFLITKIGVNPFITTLGMSYLARGLSLLITKGYAIPFSNDLAKIGGGHVGIVPIPVIIMFLVAILGVVFSQKTLIGRNIYAVGSNQRAATLSGIRSDRVRMTAYIIGGVLAGLSGIILTGMLKSADPAAGQGYEMQAIAASIIGGTALTGGEGTILGVLIGAAIMGVLKNSFVLLNLSTDWQILSLGIVLILAVVFDAYKSKKRQK